MRFDASHYVPILKGKQGELNAIKETSADIRGKFTPLIEVPPISLKYLEGEPDPIPAKSIDVHVSDVGEKIATAIGSGRSVFIDGFCIENDATLPDGSEPVPTVFKSLRDKDVRFIPVTGLDRVDEYADAVKSATATDGRGCCLRLWTPDLESDELDAQIDSLLSYLGLDPSRIDLLVDFGPVIPSRAALSYQINALPKVTEWRTLTVGCSSFPVDMSNITQNSIAEFERKEWTNWLFVRSKQIKVRMPTFADYAIKSSRTNRGRSEVYGDEPQHSLHGTDQLCVGKRRSLCAKGQQERKRSAQSEGAISEAGGYDHSASKLGG